ncbi:MAG: tRNA epoxyqueuosine(34) reductase QueG [Planctomycetota bacterium]
MISTIDRICRDQLGFAWWGIAPAAPVDHAEALKTWLDNGLHGEMRWLEEHIDLRLDPRRVLDNARSMIVVADRYASREDEPPVPIAVPHRSGRNGEHESPGILEAGGDAVGRIARYARGEDYHLRLKKRLFRLADALREQFPNESFRAAVDTAPILEREHAPRAGIAYIGRNTLAIRPGKTSYFFLGELLTTLALPLSEPMTEDYCKSCRRCVAACPTGALDQPYTLDATKCISYLTIEHRTAIDPKYHEAIGDWIFGCDICQEVCPHNGGAAQPPAPFSRRAAEAQPHEQAKHGKAGGTGTGDRSKSWKSERGLPSVPEIYQPRRSGFDLIKLLSWTEEDRRRAFVTSALKRAKLDMMKRNAIIAAGNFILLAKRDGILRREAIEHTVLTQRQAEKTAAQPGQAEASNAYARALTAYQLLHRIAALAADSNEPELVRLTARDTVDRLAAGVLPV